MATLTPREREIVLLLASGKTQAQIAKTLTLERTTVYQHVTSARRKTESASVIELAVKVALTKT